MADFVPTPSLATWGAYVKGLVVPGAIAAYLLQAAEADTTLRTRATWAAIKAAAGNTEATFTNYASKTGITPTVTLGSAVVDCDIDDQTWAAAGSTGSPQNLVKAVFCWRPTSSPSDANTIPIGIADFPETANGADLTARINATGILHASG